MTDEVIDMAWSDIHVNMAVRWATPRFVKYGVVLLCKGNSMTCLFDGDSSPRAIPEAKWYFVQGKLNPETDEHLVIIKRPEIPTPPRSFLKSQPAITGQWISVTEACEMIRMDPKQLRRHIRRGVVMATKRDDRWVIDREALQTVASKNGWL
jgi:hypothetical protein